MTDHSHSRQWAVIPKNLGQPHPLLSRISAATSVTPTDLGQPHPLLPRILGAVTMGTFYSTAQRPLVSPLNGLGAVTVGNLPLDQPRRQIVDEVADRYEKKVMDDYVSLLLLAGTAAQRGPGDRNPGKHNGP